MHRFEGKREYLGDGVYVVYERGSIVLTTENGIETTNRIVLEPEVAGAFDDWIEKVLGKRL